LNTYIKTILNEREFKIVSEGSGKRNDKSLGFDERLK